MLITFCAIYFIGICLSTPGRRYVLPALPVLIYWLVLGAGEAASYVQRWRGTSATRLLRVGQVLLAVAVLGNVVHVAQTIREARSPDFYAITDDGRMLDYFPLAKWLHENVAPGERVFTSEANVLHYFSRTLTVQSPSTLQGRGSRFQALLIREAAVTYVVVDPSRADSAEGLHRLMATRPDAFEKVRDFGKLELFRVQSGKV